ncbi:hypothetical protein K9N68_25665 [Kovacikia minuta CCNUW1]|uniref:hypothetical protein n=1 Tax=Kovacikia minuta TaxID=2931930 RepID=UPI001CC9CB42|nr:hypothetical protein [Kovacikia minuta]UBF24997.1 hypothetical protein K9N68_25665 [Kovacikia minuta CCNUW1]
MYRFAAAFFLTLVLLIACQSSRSSPPFLSEEPEQANVSLTSRTVKSSAPFVWWEAEKPTATNFPASDQNPFAPANPTEASALSGDRWIGVDGSRTVPLFLEYQVNVPQSGNYFFYSRKFWYHGPFRWRWDDQPWQTVGKRPHLMDRTVLRQFVEANWTSLGQVELGAGTHKLRLELTQKDGAAAFDCFVLTQTLFQPRGKLQPNQRYVANLPGWFIFDPEVDQFQETPLDLRFLNESFAGENGLIQVKGEEFVHQKNGRPVRFWAVNTYLPSIEMDKSLMAYMARSLAKRGVNMVRLHGKIWSDDFRKVDPADVDKLFAFVAALKQEGIYTSLSIYFPMWLQLEQTSGIPGYTGQKPFSLLFFNRDFQQIYYGWWRSLLTQINPYTGQSLSQDPAIASVEIVNEDSNLFWTFDPYKTIPSAQMEILEKQFGTWLTTKYGALDKALAAWSNTGGYKPDPARGDQPEAGRVGLIPLSQVISQRDSLRAQDTATFLTENQKQLFLDAIRFFRQELGYRGLISASNWITADTRLLGPLDKYSNTVADYMDRHGYFSGPHEGKRAAFAVDQGDLYQNRSALLFSSTNEKQPNDFNLPIMDLRYNGLPSTITEINWTPPNRFRADFPLLTAAYGLLQGTDGFFFFSTDYAWSAAIDKFAIASPAVMGQFPATALIYRKGLLQAGKSVADVSLKLKDLQALRGAPVTAPQNLDEFRAKDIPPGQELTSDRLETIDPLAFLVGKVNIHFSEDTTSSKVVELSSFIDRKAKTVRSSTGELFWNYDKGFVTANAPRVQGISGFLQQAGTLELTEVKLNSNLDYGTILLVALDDRPIAQSRRMLLQVMSEEQNFGWRSSGKPRKTIQSIGNPPIVVRTLSGQVSLKRSDAANLKVQALDINGYPTHSRVGNAAQINLLPDTFYYLIEKTS